MKIYNNNKLQLALQIQKLSARLASLLDTQNGASTKTIDAIIHATAKVTGISKQGIQSQLRVADYVTARLLVTGIAREYGHTLVDVAGHMGGRNHATIIYQANQYQKRKGGGDAEFIRLDNAIRKMLKAEDAEPVLSCCGDEMTGLDVPICPTCKEWQ